MITFFWHEIFIDVAFGKWAGGVCTKEPTSGVQLMDNSEPYRLSVFLDVNLNENRISLGNYHGSEPGHLMPKNWIPA